MSTKIQRHRDVETKNVEAEIHCVRCELHIALTSPSVKAPLSYPDIRLR